MPYSHKDIEKPVPRFWRTS